MNPKTIINYVEDTTGNHNYIKPTTIENTTNTGITEYPANTTLKETISL